MPENKEDEIDIIVYFFQLWKYKWLLIIISLISIVASFYYVKSLPKIYSATVTAIIPSESSATSGGLNSLLGSSGIRGFLVGNSSSELILEVMKSRRLSAIVVKKYNLIQHYSDPISENDLDLLAKEINTTSLQLKTTLINRNIINRNCKLLVDIDNSRVLDFLSVNDKSKPLFKKTLSKYSTSLENAIDNLQKNVNIQLGKSGIVSITISDTDREIVAPIAMYYLEALDKVNTDLQISSKFPMLQLLDFPLVPSKPTRPKVFQFVIIGSMTATLFSIILIITFNALLIKFQKDTNTNVN